MYLEHDDEQDRDSVSKREAIEETEGIECQEQNDSTIKRIGISIGIPGIHYVLVIVGVVIDGVGIVYLTGVGLGRIRRH